MNLNISNQKLQKELEEALNIIEKYKLNNAKDNEEIQKL